MFSQLRRREALENIVATRKICNRRGRDRQIEIMLDDLRL